MWPSAVLASLTEGHATVHILASEGAHHSVCNFEMWESPAVVSVPARGKRLCDRCWRAGRLDDARRSNNRR